MSVVFSGTLQGRFTSTGVAKILSIPTDVDWMEVINETVSYAAGAGTGAQFKWQRGMAQGRGVIYTKTAATNALAIGQIAAGAGFFLTDTSINVPSAPVTITSITNAAPPVVATGSTAGLNNGDIVRLYNVTGAQQLGGVDFTIGSIVADTSFTLAYMAAIVAAAGGSPSAWRKIPYNPIYYPRNRTISAITQAAQAVVTLTVTHGYLPGQKIRFVIPEVNASKFGMTELDGVEATIVAVNTSTNTITVDVDSSAFTAFAWPLTADGAFTPAQVVPIGMNTAEANTLAVNSLTDATINQALIGMTLAAGTGSPAGVNNDVIYWIAGKSFSVDNQ